MKLRTIIAALSDVRVRAGLALGAVLAIGATGTYAYWTDSVPVTGTTITAGTLDLKVDGQDSVSDYTDLTMTNMVPGNSSAAVLTVTNSGTIPLTYSIDASAAGTLGSALSAKITTDASTDGSGSVVTCPGDALSGSGPHFTSGLLPSSAARTLAAGAGDTICVQATLPSDAASTLQGQSTTITLTFDATQKTS